MNEKINDKGIIKCKIKSFLLYTLPFIIEYLFLQSTDFVDTTLSSHVGETTIVGISTMVLIIAVIRIFPKVMANTNEIIISPIYGKNKKDDKINIVTFNALAVSFLINITIIVLVACFAKYIINFMGLKFEAILIAKNYLIIRLIGCLIVPFEQIIQSYLKVINKNKQVMNIKIVYTVLNIIGDTFSVINGYGAIGIAVSTVICEYIQVILLVIVNRGIIFRKIQRIVIKELLNIFKINIFSKLGHRLGVVIFTSLASNLEQNIYANYVLAIQIMYLGTSISEAIGEATLIKIGHTIGKNDKEDLQKAKRISIQSSYVIAIIQVLLFLIFGKLLLAIISNNSYSNIAINLLYLFIVEMITETLHYPFEGYLLALKEVKYVTIVNLTGVLIIRIISALIFMKLGLGIYGIALALILDYFIRYLRYISKAKKL